MYKITLEESYGEPDAKYPSYRTIYEQTVEDLVPTDIINAVNKAK